MTENNSDSGIPDKPLQPPALHEEQGTDTNLSPDPDTNGTASSNRRWWSERKKVADSPKLAGATLPPAFEQTVGAESRPVRTRRKLAWYWVAGIACLLLASGIGIGFTLPDPTNSKEYVALTSDKQGLQSDLNKLQGRFDTLDAGIKGREAKVQAREDAVAKADALVKSADAAVKKREEAVTSAEKTKAANTIKEGTWTVGVDLEPGTYRTNSDVTSGCYWGIYRTGSNGSDIVDNDIVTGGRPSVTLSAGQDFKSSRCGTWSKQ
ncbi:hypothetical protein [Arthrobacter humicola]